MNWTERALVRHSKPSKGREVLLRQKEHFAKVRAGVINAKVKPKPPSISRYVHPAHSPPTSHHSSVPKTSARSSSNEPTISHDYTKTILSFQNVTDFQDDQIGDAALREKRRKLLLKGDWTGITLQKPINMDFSKPQASLGCPWGQSKLRNAKSKSKMRGVLGTKCNGGQTRVPKTVVKTTGPTLPIQIRVRVGSRELIFGNTSNVSPQSRTYGDVESIPQGMCNGKLLRGPLADAMLSHPQFRVDTPRETPTTDATGQHLSF